LEQPHLSNESGAIEVTVVGIETLVKFKQAKNASDPIAVTLSGMVIAVTLVQYAKATRPMLATLSGMTVSLSQGTHWTTPRGLLSSSTANDNPNPKHDGRARSPTVVTLVGMVMVFKFEQN
jgi:hypothetical protein